jgi:hypothetical protein
MYHIISFLLTDDNSLTGTIPSQIGLMKVLHGLNLREYILFLLTLQYYKILTRYHFISFLLTDDNSVTGTIPSQIGLMKGLKTLNLSEYILFLLSLLYFKILTMHHFISFLSTGGNSINGTIPTELGLLSNAEVPFGYMGLREYILVPLSLLYYKILTRCIASIRFSWQGTIPSLAPFQAN